MEYPNTPGFRRFHALVLLAAAAVPFVWLWLEHDGDWNKIRGQFIVMVVLGVGALVCGLIYIAAVRIADRRRHRR